MPKPRTAFNDLEIWREYCERLGEHPFPKTIFDPLKINASNKNKRIEGFWTRTNDNSATPFNGDHLAEARAPIARAIAAIRLAKRVKKDFTKRSHLATAITWLDCPHPWQGEATKKEISAMITEIKQAIVNPNMPLDHLLDNSLCFKAQAHVSPADERPKKPSFLGSALKRLSGGRKS